MPSTDRDLKTNYRSKDQITEAIIVLYNRVGCIYCTSTVKASHSGIRRACGHCMEKSSVVTVPILKSQSLKLKGRLTSGGVSRLENTVFGLGGGLRDFQGE